MDIASLVKEYNNNRPIKVVANLPYYITTPIIMDLFENHIPLSGVTIMIQKEVADRIQAVPGSKDYGALSLGGPILCKALYCCKCTSELLYAPSKSRLCGNKSDSL